jgi:hypothetical protein
VPGTVGILEIGADGATTAEILSLV